MSISLEFYSVAWSEIQAILGSRQRKFLRSILDGPARDILEDLRGEGKEEARNFEAALERWIFGEVQGQREEDHQLITDDSEMLAFSAIMQAQGRLVGDLSHTISSGDLFRNQFLAGTAQNVLKAPFPVSYLISRPLFGYESDDFPYWGGLTRQELGSITARLDNLPPRNQKDTEVNQWLEELWAVLGSAVDLNSDLITIYG